mgnify:CR=1 FL=1
MIIFFFNIVELGERFVVPSQSVQSRDPAEGFG